MSGVTSLARGLLAVISGPSGVGKSTIIKLLLEDPRFALSVSATTRAPRRGEVDGREYYFLTRDEFQRRVSAGEFLEYATVHGKNFYGTLSSEIERLIAAQRIVILDIDVQGARALRGRRDAAFIFIAPPDIDELIRRLESRGTENPETLAARLASARAEMAEMQSYDHVVVNDDLVRAAAGVRDMLLAEAARVNTLEGGRR